jgi:hypothetical protein
LRCHKLGGRQDEATGRVRVDHHHVAHHHQVPKQILVTCTEELVTTDTLTDNDKELTAADIFATNGEKFGAATVLAATKSDVNVDLAEKDHIVNKTHMCVISLKITKNNGADSKKFAVKVYRVEAEIEEFNVEQQETKATAPPPSPQEHQERR